jgi:O-antigen/teichoic acid export membrane protein
MQKKLLSFIKTDTSINVLINTAGNYLNVFFTAFFAVLLVRFLPPVEYGVLSVLLAISYVMANILDFGATATIYSSLPKFFETKSESLYRFLKSIFIFQTGLATIAVLFLWIYFPQIDKVFFKTEASFTALSLTAFSIFFYIWQNFLTNSLFATKKFLTANIYLNIANLVKLVVVLILYFYGKISVETVILSFGIIGPISIFSIILISKYKLLKNIFKASFDKQTLKIKYTLTYFLASQFYNLALRMDLFMLSFFGLKPEVGYYGLAQKIILTISASAISISQVLSPQFAAVKSSQEIKKIVTTGFSYMALPSALFIILFFIPEKVFSFVFTKDFSSSSLITNYLAIPFILNTLGTVPHLFLLYTARKPIYIFYSNIVLLLTVALGSYVLIPKYGMFGLPVALSIGFILAITLQLVGIMLSAKNIFTSSKSHNSNL